MKMLQTLSIAAALAGLSVSAFAQVAGPGTGAPPVITAGKAHHGAGKQAKKMHEAILNRLNLTAVQRTRIDQHDKATEVERKVLAKSEKGTKGAGKSEATKEKLKALRKENGRFYKEVLTKDQLKEMKKLRREAKREAGTKNGVATPIGKP